MSNSEIELDSMIGLNSETRAKFHKILTMRDNEVLGSIGAQIGEGTYGDPAVVVNSKLFPSWGHIVNLPTLLSRKTTDKKHIKTLGQTEGPKPMSERIAVYAASFDPITNGHLWMIKTGLELFDRLIILVANNPAKKTMFSQEMRHAMVQATVDKLSNGTMVKVLALENTEYAVDLGYNMGAIS